MTEMVTFGVSQDLLASLRIGVQDLGRYMRVNAALAYFQEKKLSLGKAAELAGMNRLEFMDLLAQRRMIVFDYDESIVDSELRGVAVLAESRT